jgi:hypothetical protein
VEAFGDGVDEQPGREVRADLAGDVNLRSP